MLERIQEQEELARILDEVVGELDAPELEPVMARGSAYRRALEEEISRVVRSEEWAWYTGGEHYREIEFLHLNEARAWRVGAFDLYRPDDPEDWIIDFKTHEIDADAVEETARGYALQAEVYRAASAVRRPARVRLHFTAPGVVVDLGVGRED